MKTIIASLLSCLFLFPHSLSAQNPNYYSYNTYNYRSSFYSSNYNRRRPSNMFGVPRVVVYNYRPNYYTFNRNSNGMNTSRYNSYYNQNYSSFNGFLFNFYRNNR
jgi:hypothetical protein